MKPLFFALTVPLLCFSGAPHHGLEDTLRKQYEAAAHWGGEISGEETPERIEEINRGAKKDCAVARKSVATALTAKDRSVVTSALTIQIVEICNLGWAEKINWKSKLAPLCKETKSYFKSLKPEANPDGQSAYSSLCQ